MKIKFPIRSSTLWVSNKGRVGEQINIPQPHLYLDVDDETGLIELDLLPWDKDELDEINKEKARGIDLRFTLTPDQAKELSKILIKINANR